MWVRYPALPYNCWTSESLSRISSVIGKSICADDCTSRVKRISYARVRFEVDVTQEIRTKIQFEFSDGRVQFQQVIYEWLPWFCLKCDKVGHFFELDPIMKWVPKVRAANQNKVITPPPTQVQQPLSTHDAGWVAATKVERSTSRLQRSLGIQKSVFHPLDKS